MKYKDLRDFIAQLEQRGLLTRIKQEIDPVLEMTEIADRTLRAGGPALLFENPKGFDIPVLANLFGTPERVALGMGQPDVGALREVGKLLAFLKEPEPPKGLKDAWDKLPIFRQVLNMAAKVVKKAPCQQIVLQGDQVDLTKLPVMTCWPGDAAPLITWGLTITRGPHKERQNLGIYRQQVLGKNKVIMRWLSHRGGALDFLEWQKAHPGERFPVPLGFCMAIPDGYEVQVRPRSGLAVKHGVTVLNAPGTVDADYRGEVSVILINHGPEPFQVERHMRIAQLVIARYSRVHWQEAESLAESQRGSGGYGSTGV